MKLWFTIIYPYYVARREWFLWKLAHLPESASNDEVACAVIRFVGASLTASGIFRRSVERALVK